MKPRDPKSVPAWPAPGRLCYTREGGRRGLGVWSEFFPLGAALDGNFLLLYSIKYLWQRWMIWCD